MSDCLQHSHEPFIYLFIFATIHIWSTAKFVLTELLSFPIYFFISNTLSYTPFNSAFYCLWAGKKKSESHTIEKWI